MKLEEAWIIIKDMKDSNRFNPNQIYSILADMGIFKDNPRFRLVIKSALYYNLWDIIIASSISNALISKLKSKLLYDGFSNEVIDDLLCSFQKSIPVSLEDLKNEKRYSPEQSDKYVNNLSNSHIVFLGKELGCSESEMINHLKNRGFRHIGFSYDGTRAEYSGSFLGYINSVVAIWKTPKTKIVYKIEIRVKAKSDIITDIYNKKYRKYYKSNINRSGFILPYGGIYIRPFYPISTTIEYEDKETLRILKLERSEENQLKELLAQRDRNNIINQVDLDDI